MNTNKADIKKGGKMKQFKFKAWIHPKQGGDDYSVEIEAIAENLKMAKKEVEKLLAKKSDVIDDYKVV